MIHQGIKYKRVVKGLVGALFFIGINLLIIDFSWAAGPPAPPGGGGGTPPCWPAPCVPIDGGLSLLVAAGLAYGGKKAYDTFKEETT